VKHLTIGPRYGPSQPPNPHLTIWARRIGSRHLHFWIWPDRIEVWEIPETTPPKHLHTYRKEHNPR
jgi:hypothetical protein